MRLVDVTPTVLDLMGVDYNPADFDGQAVKRPEPKG
jgi:arylsulfatase A-like enzyme